MNLFASHREISPNEFIETIGIEFDAFEPGMVIEHRPGFTFSWTEACDRARFAGDHSPVLMDRSAAILAGGGKEAISEGWVVGAFAAATTRAFGRVVANLAWENIVFPNRVRDGETVFAVSTIIGKRDSSSRPDQGILHVRTQGFARDSGVEVCGYERKLLVYRGAQGPHEAAGYA